VNVKITASTATAASFALATNNQLGSVLDAGWYLHFDTVGLAFGTTAGTILTGHFHRLPFTLASRATRHLLELTEKRPLCAPYPAFAVACRTFDYIGTRLSFPAFAPLAPLQSGQFEFAWHAKGCITE
jgi:hypothetical protein